MRSGEPTREPLFTLPLEDDPEVVLYVERLRDGRVALGTRARDVKAGGRSGELHLLSPGAVLALAGWLAPVVVEGWLPTVRERRAEQLNTALDLHGQGVGAVERFAAEILREIPPGLLLRALLLLVNSIGPEARERLVSRLNRTRDRFEEEALRRQLAEERETFAYALAAAALFDALEDGLSEEEPMGG